MSSSSILRAYVDETGDRGTSATASPFFAMAGVVVAEEHEEGLRNAIRRCRHDLGVPPGRVLHWKAHVKTFARRQHVASCLGGLAGVCLNYVIFEKAAIPSQAALNTNQVVFYNYVAGIMMERLLLTAKGWPGGRRPVKITFGHVRGFGVHRTTKEYFDVKRAKGSDWIPWELLHGAVRFDSQASSDGLQAADQYAGMLSAALRANEFGNYQEHHFVSICQQIRCGPDGRRWGYGFKVMAQTDAMSRFPWWPVAGF